MGREPNNRRMYPVREVDRGQGYSGSRGTHHKVHEPAVMNGVFDSAKSINS